jgi:histidinol dehydrogenase
MIKRYSKKPKEILDKRWPQKSFGANELTQYVSKILDYIKGNGIEAILEYTEKFDGVKLESDRIQVTKEEIKQAYDHVTKDQIEALEESKKRLKKIEMKRLNQQHFKIKIDGVEIFSTSKPLRRVGCYVPGGKNPYPSTVVMNAVPARVAGVEEVTICTPPNINGEISPVLLVAADICEVNKIYKLGGIQAVAAMAYGFPPVKKVDKIVGPGNKYVTEAKRLVSGTVAIDKPAGPSEILIIADRTANPHLISLDLISQAEHGPGGLSGLVTTSKKLADDVEQEIPVLLDEIPNRKTVEKVMNEGGFIYTADSLEKAIDFANEFAPEHLELIIEKPERYLEKIQNAGMILLGEYTPVASTDYCMGVNHVLPTEGYAKIRSGLTVLDFIKTVSIIKAQKKDLVAVKKHIQALSQAEGLENHYLALEARIQ